MRKYLPGVLLALSVSVFALTGCTGTSPASSTAASASADVLAPEEISEDPVSSAAASAPTPAVSMAGAAAESVPKESKPADTASSVQTESNGGTSVLDPSESGVIYLIVPSETGTSAAEKEAVDETAAGAGFDLVVKAHGNDPETQTAAFDEAIRCHASAIICDNADEEETLASVQAAKAAGIPTFLIDRGIKVTGVAAAQILTDRFSSVALLAQIFAGEREGETSYIELGEADGDSAAADAMAAFDDAISSFKKMKLAAKETQSVYDAQDAREKIAGLLKENPSAGALVCYNERQAMAGIEVLSEQDRPDIDLLCIYGDGDDMEGLVTSGQVRATIVKPAEFLAKTAAEEAILYLRNGTTGENERQYVNATILTAPGIRNPEESKGEGS